MGLVLLEALCRPPFSQMEERCGRRGVGSQASDRHPVCPRARPSAYFSKTGGHGESPASFTLRPVPCGDSRHWQGGMHLFLLISLLIGICGHFTYWLGFLATAHQRFNQTKRPCGLSP